jgi:hypothetical protein
MPAGMNSIYPYYINNFFLNHTAIKEIVKSKNDDMPEPPPGTREKYLFSPRKVFSGITFMSPDYFLSRST